ncbi:MAG TPA: HAD family acid phosphatase [Opitutaceae bacterium]|nr:HAD family acid phosphatase [Opitutaceae bacterium]
MRRRLLALVALGALAGCATPPEPRPGAPAAAVAEPPNLWVLKQELIAYADSGDYERGLAAVAQEARRWIEHRAAAGPAPAGAGRLAIVLDLDETLLSNLPHMRRQDFGYVPSAWDAWVAESSAPAIKPVADVYRAARRHGVAVFYLTGRRAHQQGVTEENLRRLGLADHAGLHCKPDDFAGTTESFKTGVRRRLTAEGWIIIANIGDQHSDLTGGHAERIFKLPNPYYVTK